jgi:hypothetical protein
MDPRSEAGVELNFVEPELLSSTVAKESRMKFRKTMLAAMCAASLGAVSVSTTAGAAVDIYFNAPPPAARYEVVPAPRQGYTWSTGYWGMNNQKHVWKDGHWEKNRQGYYLAQPTWTQRDNKWQLQHGQWNQGDRDHDGVPNAVDRAPDNPNRH